MAADLPIGKEIARYNWNQEALFRTVHSWIPSDKLDLLDNAVLASCDGAHGVIDSLIQDPRKCTLNPSVLACSSDPDPDTDSLCLSIDQVKMVRAIYSGAVDQSGRHIYPGFTKSDPGGTDG
jgi:feruloyl esterase